MGDASHFRRSARRPVELAVTLRRDAADASLSRRGELVDLSMTGAQVRVGSTPDVGRRVRVTLSAPSAWDPLELRAEVRWADADSETFGVAFDRLAPHEATALHELLAVSRFADVGDTGGRTS